MSKENFCPIINLGRWLWDFISDIMGCNCKNKPNRYDGNI